MRIWVALLALVVALPAAAQQRPGQNVVQLRQLLNNTLGRVNQLKERMKTLRAPNQQQAQQAWQLIETIQRDLKHLVAVTPVVVHGGGGHVKSGPQPMTAAQFASFYQSFSRQGAPPQRLQFLRNVRRHSWFGVDQVISLLQGFDPVRRLEVIEILKGRIADRNNIHKLYGQLPSNYQRQLREILGGRR